MKKSKHESTIILNLYRINTILAKRVRRGEHFYLLLVAFASLLLIAFWGVLLFTNLIEFENEEQIKIAFSATTFFIFAFDVLFTLSRFQSGTLIEPYHLNIFPIGKIQKIKFNLLLMLIDYKSLIYFSTTLLLVAFFLKELSLLKALLSVTFILAFLLTMTIWSFVVYNILGEFLIKTRSNVLVAFSCLIIFFNIVSVTNKLSLFSSLPIISYVGNALYALKTSDLPLAVVNSLFLCSSLLIGILILRFLPLRKN